METDKANDETYKDLMGILPSLPAKIVNEQPPAINTHHQTSNRELKIEAVRKIVKAWRSYSMRQTFSHLKESLHRAVRFSWTCDCEATYSPAYII